MTDLTTPELMEERNRRDWTILEAERLANEFADLRCRVGVQYATVIWLFPERDGVGGAKPLPPWKFASTAVNPGADLNIRAETKACSYGDHRASVGEDPEFSTGLSGEPFVVYMKEADELPPWLDYVLYHGVGCDELIRPQRTDWQFVLHERWAAISTYVYEAEFPPKIDEFDLMGRVFIQVNCVGIERIRPRAFKLLRAFQQHLKSSGDLGRRVEQAFCNVGVMDTIGWVNPEDWCLAVAALSEHQLTSVRAERHFAFAAELPFWGRQWVLGTAQMAPGDWRLPPMSRYPYMVDNGRPWFVMEIDDFVRACELTCRWMAAFLRAAPIELMKSNEQPKDSVRVSRENSIRQRRRGKSLELTSNAARILSDSGMKHEEIAQLFRYETKSAISKLINRED